jgi:hypothetical protein
MIIIFFQTKHAPESISRNEITELKEFKRTTPDGRKFQPTNLTFKLDRR